MKKTFFLTLSLILLINCNKSYFNDVGNLKKWTTNATPNFGLPLVNIGIGYAGLLGIIPSDSSFSISALKDNTVFVQSYETLLTTFGDFFKVNIPNLNVNQLNVPIGNKVPFTINVPLIAMNNSNGTITAIAFQFGSINLALSGDIASNISSINLNIGGADTTISNPKVSNGSVNIPFSLAGKKLSITNGNIVVSMTITTTNGNNSTGDIVVTTTNLSQPTITVNNFAADVQFTKKVALSFFRDMNTNFPGSLIRFKHPTLSLYLYNTDKINATVGDITFQYIYKDGTMSLPTTVSNISTNNYQVFDLGNDFTNAITDVVFTFASVKISAPSIELSEKLNFAIKSSFDFPLVVTVKNVFYEDTLNIPVLSTSNISYINKATLKVQTYNTMPIRLTSSKLIAFNDANVPIDSIAIPNILYNSQNANTIALDTNFIKQLFRYRKGRFSVKLETVDASSGYATFTTKDSLHIKLGIALEINGKKIFTTL